VRITFLGTGTSSGVPVIACECATCRSDDARDRRWRTSVALALDDGTSVLVDASPDLRAQALAFGLTRVDTILLTHEHADHVLGLDDVRIYNFRQRRAIPCLGTARTLARVRGMFSYVFDPATPRGGGLPQLALSTVVGPFSIGGRTVVPIPLLHVAQPMPLLRRRPQRLAQHGVRVSLHGHFARPRPVQRPADTQEVAEIEILERLVIVRVEPVPGEADLNVPTAVPQCGERQPPHSAHGHQPPNDGDAMLRILIVLEERPRLGGCVRTLRSAWIGVNTPLAQPFQLGQS